ncbi:hypothetical protein KI387_002661 [Taxus chinensis]|uniref:Uncharacterized protein n=1 Tax=Taxus chinensis TaxID=29808 RepID=A0AA38GXZ0_TAXCH|nr:hypothetical protein KI387_002661 [Taxus chinensis]
MDVGLANLVVSKIRCGVLEELVDPNLEIDVKLVVKDMVCRVAELAFRCLTAEKDDRHNMMEVVAQLQKIKQFGYGGRIRTDFSMDANLWPYCTTKAYAGLRHCGDAFFKVYGDLFKKIFDMEMAFTGAKGLENFVPAPLFGSLETPQSEVFHFYNY